MRSKNHTRNGRVAREQRRQDAQARQAVREARTPLAQHEVLNQRLGNLVGATRERARIEAQWEAGTE